MLSRYSPQACATRAPARPLSLSLLLCGALLLAGASEAAPKREAKKKAAKAARPAASQAQAQAQNQVDPEPTPPAQCPPSAQAPSAEELQAAQERAADRGLLWRVSKDGRHAYLFGSIHIGKLDWAIPGPKMAAALQDSDMLALELDPGDPMVQQQMTAGLARRRLAPDAPLRQRLAQHEAEACLPKGTLAAIPHPLMQAFTLTLLAARWEGLDPAYAQEQVLSGMARSVQRTVVSLESVELQLNALLPKDKRQAQQATAELLDLLERGQARPVLRRLAEAWERSDLDTLERYQDWCECARNAAERAQLQRLNDGRNPMLAERIDALVEAGHQPFAAVGALHMTGAQALPRLLEKRGYQVERLQ